MLKLLNDSDKDKLVDFCLGSIHGTRISCYVLSYGFDRSFVSFWGEFKDDELVTAVALFDSALTVLSSADTDFPALSEFLNMISWHTLTASEDCVKALRYTDFVTKQGYRFNGTSDESELCVAPSEEDMQGIYTLISHAIPDSFSEDREAYLSFLSDFTFRKTRGYSRALCIKHNSAVVASVITSAENEKFAVISGVACDEKIRKSGYGKKIVLAIVDMLKSLDKSCFVIALNESAEGFYEHIGFEKDEKISTVTRKVI